MTYKENFIKFMVASGVLTFGDYTLKSGRKSPYFLNVGNYNTGAALATLGDFYAECINEHVPKFDTLFGPSYKGVPLCVCAALALNSKYGMDVNYTFDRKEAKNHGEGGIFVGKQPADGDRIVIIDDVITSGKALYNILPKLTSAADVYVSDMVITVDRMEKSLNSDMSTVEQIYKDLGIRIYSIVNIKDIIMAIENGVIEGKKYLDAMMTYLDEYGVIK